MSHALDLIEAPDGVLDVQRELMTAARVQEHETRFANALLRKGIVQRG